MDELSAEGLTRLYEQNGLFAKIIDTPAEEALRRGLLLDSAPHSAQDYILDTLHSLHVEDVFANGVRWARLFGGALGVILAADGGGLESPLSAEKVTAVTDVVVYESPFVRPLYLPHNPRTPAYYHIQSRRGEFVVHASRCLVFRNGSAPENATKADFEVWGVPEYDRIGKAIEAAERAHDAAFCLLRRNVQVVYKMQGLSAVLAAEGGRGSDTLPPRCA